MIQVQCSGCGTTYSFQPATIAQTFHCTTCNTTVAAPATAQPVASPSAHQTQPAGQAPFARPVTLGGQAAAPTATPAAAVGSAPTATPASQLTATTPPHLSKPPALPQQRNTSGGGSEADDADEPTQFMPAPSAGRGLLWTLAGTVFVLLLVGGGVALYYARPDLFTSESESTLEEAARGSGGNFQNSSSWIEVAEKNVGQRIGEIKLRVERLEYGEVLAKDRTGRVIDSNDQHFLQIYLHLENAGGQEVEYVSWYGNPFVTESGGQVAARLTDNTRRVYDMMVFDDVDKIKGHVPRAILKTSNVGNDRKFVDDVLIFEVAEGVDLSTVEYFRLELPAEAHGRTGKYRLQIPGSRLVDGDAPN